MIALDLDKYELPADVRDELMYHMNQYGHIRRDKLTENTRVFLSNIISQLTENEVTMDDSMLRNVAHNIQQLAESDFLVHALTECKDCNVLAQELYNACAKYVTRYNTIDLENTNARKELRPH